MTEKSTTRRLLSEYKRRGLTFWNRYKQNRAAVVGFGFILFLFIIAVLSPSISPYDPYSIDLKDKLAEPTTDHLFGTDTLGRDLYSRVLWGTRISLFVGFISASVSALIGVLVGSVSGYYGGKIDSVIMRVVDIFLTIPTFFLILLVVAFFGSNINVMMLVIGATIWPGTARMVRAEFLTFKHLPFVDAARISGASDRHIMFKEILPNAVFPAVVNSTLQVAGAILYESALAFLGLGDPNVVSWGGLLKDALKIFLRSPWLAIYPGLAISITVVAFNLMGDGLNDSLNPYLKER